MAARRLVAPALGGVAVIAAVVLAWLWVGGTDPPQAATPLVSSVEAGERGVTAPVVVPADAPEPLAVASGAGTLEASSWEPVPWAGAPAAAPEPTRLGVIVVDDQRRPVPDARIEIRAPGDVGRVAEGALVETSTDGLGRSRVEVRDADARLFASHDDVGTSGLWSLAALLAASDEAGDVVVPLLAPATLRGAVTEPDGLPVPGARVHVMVPGGPLAPRTPDVQITDLDGRFEVAIDAVARLVAWASEGARESSPLRLSPEPGAVHELPLVLPGRWSVQGVVLDPSGEPVPGALVMLWRTWPGYDVQAEEFPPEEPHRVETLADEEGAFHLDVQARGLYTLVAYDDGRAPSAPVDVSVTDAQPRVTAWLQLFEASAITGRLVDGTGAPLPGILVHARPAHLRSLRALEYAPTPWGLHGRADVETGDDGSFVLEPLHPEGVYIVFARPEEDRDDRKLVVKDVPAGTHDLLLVASEENLRRATIEGRVVSAVGGRPIEDFETTLVIELDGRVLVTDDLPVRERDGAFRFEGLAPGYRYALRVDAEGHGPFEQPLSVARAGGPALLVELPPLGSLEIQTGVPLAEVSARRRSELFAVDRERTTHADEQGAARWPRLAPGRYDVAIRTGSERHSAEVEVLPGEPAVLELEERP